MNPERGRKQDRDEVRQMLKQAQWPIPEWEYAWRLPTNDGRGVADFYEDELEKAVQFVCRTYSSFEILLPSTHEGIKDPTVLVIFKDGSYRGVYPMPPDKEAWLKHMPADFEWDDAYLESNA